MVKYLVSYSVRLGYPSPISIRSRVITIDRLIRDEPDLETFKEAIMFSNDCGQILDILSFSRFDQ